jgi:pimeloyl-ACP methyl ester carboxylesterase
MSRAVTSDGASQADIPIGTTAGPALRPWWHELGSVLPRSVSFASRATRAQTGVGIPTLSANPLSWATIAIDELAVSSAYLLTRRRAEQLTMNRLEAAERAVTVLDTAGVLDDPSSLYPAPAAPCNIRLSKRSRGGLEFEQVSFDSVPAPSAGIGDLTEWQVDSNERVHAYLLRHEAGPRPWAVVIHGHRMGESRDLRLLGSRQLYHVRGVNVAHLVLPMHGPRGRVDAHNFPGVDAVANLLGVAQAVSDARALIAWIRDQTTRPVGVFGVSLGGLVASMLAAFEPDLACVIAGVPLTNIASMLAATVETRWGAEVLAESHFLDAAPVELSRLASPLSFAPVVPLERRFIYAAIGDRLVTARQAELLWQHWDRPPILWLQGAHILNNVRASRRFVSRAFAASGVDRH